MASAATVLGLVRSRWGCTTSHAPDTFLVGDYGVTSTGWIQDLATFVDPTVFGFDEAPALAALAAHVARVVDPEGAYGGGAGAGPVSSLRTSKLAVTYAAPVAAGGDMLGDAALAATAPGRYFLALRQRRPLTHIPLVVG